MFKQELEYDTTFKPRSKEYRRLCLQKIHTSWPGLWEMRLDEITPLSYREWATKLHGEIASHYFNNTLGTLRLVIHVGLEFHKKKRWSRF